MYEAKSGVPGADGHNANVYRFCGTSTPSPTIGYPNLDCGGGLTSNWTYQMPFNDPSLTASHPQNSTQFFTSNQQPVSDAADGYCMYNGQSPSASFPGPDQSRLAWPVSANSDSVRGREPVTISPSYSGPYQSVGEPHRESVQPVTNHINAGVHMSSPTAHNHSRHFTGGASRCHFGRSVSSDHWSGSKRKSDDDGYVNPCSINYTQLLYFLVKLCIG